MGLIAEIMVIIGIASIVIVISFLLYWAFGTTSNNFKSSGNIYQKIINNGTDVDIEEEEERIPTFGDIYGVVDEISNNYNSDPLNPYQPLDGNENVTTETNFAVVQTDDSSEATSDSLGSSVEDIYDPVYTTTGSIFSDPAFSDLIIYKNTINTHNVVLQTGIDKCLKSCDGTCMEYGLTGIGVCFPDESNEEEGSG